MLFVFDGRNCTAVWENMSLLLESESNNTFPAPLPTEYRQRNCDHLFYSKIFLQGLRDLSQLVSLSLQLYAFSHHIESDLLCNVFFHFLDFWSSQSNLDLKELVGNSDPTHHLNAWMLNIECV